MISCCCQSCDHLLILILFVVLSNTHLGLLVEGRSSGLKLLQVKGVEKNEEFVLRGVIGSRPPNCERRCNSCEHCEAIQVPASPFESKVYNHYYFSSFPRGGDNSNYKPLSWKCKCGDSIFNP